MLAVTLPEKIDGTLAWAIEHYLRDMEQLEQAPSKAQRYAMRAIQKMPIGAKRAASLEGDDFLEHCKSRRHGIKKVCAATTNHDLCNIRGVLKYMRSAKKECKGFAVALAELDAVQPMLLKLNLYGNGIPRAILSTDEQDDTLKAYFTTHKCSLPMVNLINAAKISSRRLGELCRIEIQGIDWNACTYWVQDVKHPTKKIGNHKQFVLFPEIAAVFRQQANGRAEGKLFACDPKSVSAAFGRAMQDTSISGIRFHDYRAKAISYWLQRGLTKEQVADMVSGHETTKQIDKTYDRRTFRELMEGVSIFLSTKDAHAA